MDGVGSDVADDTGKCMNNFFGGGQIVLPDQLAHNLKVLAMMLGKKREQAPIAWQPAANYFQARCHVEIGNVGQPGAQRGIFGVSVNMVWAGGGEGRGICVCWRWPSYGFRRRCR